MHKNNLIRFVHSLVLLPLLTGSIPLTANQTVLSQKQNIEAEVTFIPNKVEDAEAKVREAKASAIDSYFEKNGMPLKGTGKKMVEEAEKYGLDWRLIPAIAVRESTGGKHACKKAAYNAFGWGSCKISFSSHEKAIETIARNLAGENPNTAHHYDGKDTKGILLSYNPPSIVPKYASEVMAIMKDIGDEKLIIQTI